MPARERRAAVTEQRDGTERREEGGEGGGVDPTEEARTRPKAQDHSFSRPSTDRNFQEIVQYQEAQPPRPLHFTDSKDPQGRRVGGGRSFPDRANAKRDASRERGKRGRTELHERVSTTNGNKNPKEAWTEATRERRGIYNIELLGKRPEPAPSWENQRRWWRATMISRGVEISIAGGGGEMVRA